MIVEIGDLYPIMLQSMVIFLILYVIFRKYIISVFDPLFFYVITQAFSIELAFIDIQNPSYLIHFLLSQAFFTLGFISVGKTARPVSDEKASYTEEQIRLVNYFNFFAFIVVLLANLYFIYARGLIILSDDPSISKFSEFEGGGMGAIRRINWGLSYLLLTSAFFVYVKTKSKMNLAIVVVLFLLSGTSGAKGAFLTIISLIALVGVIPSVKKEAVFKRIDRLKIPVLALGGVLAIFILMFSGGEGTIDSAVLKLGIRFLYFGDSIIYYYTESSVKYFSTMNFFDFLSYEFNSILGILRIVDYRPPLGNDLLLYFIDKDVDFGAMVGPNTPYYVKGHIFMGYIGGLIYSFVVGAILGYCRKLLFAQDGKPFSMIKIILIIYLNVIMCNYPQDSQLITSMLNDTLLFALLPAGLVMLVYYVPKPSGNYINQVRQINH
jgi:oligosaccharide repeat unit polymerase